MSIIYVCDSCGAQSDDDVKVYEFSDEVKKIYWNERIRPFVRGVPKRYKRR